MLVSITIVKYNRIFIPFAFISMAIFRVPLLLSKSTFWKLLGTGKNGTFDIKPDFYKWGLLTVWRNDADSENFYKNSFIQKWWNLFTVEQFTIVCEPLESHGYWSGKQPFSNPKSDYNSGKIAILTRATIRFNRLKNFWRNVPKVASIMGSAKGFITSFGIGEAPFFMQATFSVWESLDDVKHFAYHSSEHKEVIKLTRKENWYKEELFARFRILKTFGTIDGKNYDNII